MTCERCRELEAEIKKLRDKYAQVVKISEITTAICEARVAAALELTQMERERRNDTERDGALWFVLFVIMSIAALSMVLALALGGG